MGDKIGDPFIYIGEWEHHLLWELDQGGLNPGDSTEHRKQLPKGDIAIPKDIPFPQPASLHRSKVTNSHILHIDKVHAGVQVGPHAPFHKVYDYLPSWCGLYIVFTDWRGGVHNHHRKASPSELQHLQFSQVFGLFVIPGHLGWGNGGILCS